ncbi:hypothetical protein [Yersinia aldovae]|uniref:hypothetical protein n=1 Tax=Yersinia aldovae TaxID=29483 RepID=UPI0021BD3019|nr:hypothetical protein [Yersinia aldovae]
MKKLLIRLIPDAIYQALESIATRSERSLEGHARYVLTASVEQEQKRSGGERYQHDVTQRLQTVLPLANAVIQGPSLTPAILAEKLRHRDAVEVENWFTGHAVPAFCELDSLGEILGCSAEWLKFGESSPFPMTGQRRINWKGGGVLDAEDLLEPDEKGNSVDFVYIIRLSNDVGNVLILRTFNNTLKTDFFYTNLHLSEQIGNGGFHDLCDFLVTLQALYRRYVKGKFHVKSYDLSEAVFNDLYVKNSCHPLYLIRHGARESVWWEDIWHREMLTQKNTSGDYYFWPDDKKLIDRLLNKLEEKGRLDNENSLENVHFGLPTEGLLNEEQ